MDAYNLAELGQTLFEEAGDALFLFDPDSEQILDANPVAQRLSGFTRRDLLRMQASYLFRSEAKGGLARLRHAFKHTQVFHSQEDFVLRHREDGVWIPVNLTLARLHVRPRTLGVITARDVREHRETLAQLKKAQERLRTVVANSPVVLFAIDLAGVITLCEGKGLELAGIQAGELLGRSVFQVYRQAPQLLKNIYRVLAGETFTAIADIEGGPGAGCSFETHYTPLRDRHGQVTGAIGIATDITERKRTEKALRDSEAFYHSLVESLPQNILRKDVEGHFTFANQRACAALQKPVEEILGKTDLDFFPPALVEKYRRDDRWVMDTGEMLEAVEEYVEPGGEKLYVQIVKTPLYDGGGVIMGTQVIFWDVSRQKRTELRLIAQHEVTRLLAESSTLRATLPKILQIICESMGWQAGIFWRIDRRANVLFCEDVGHLPGAADEDFQADTRQRTFARGSGLPGRVWESGEVAWTEDIAQEDGGPAGGPRRGALAFPVWLGREVIGVLEFFNPEIRPPDEDVLRMMATLGSQIGQFIERKQAEEALEEERNLLRTLIDNLPDHIFVKDAEGHYVLDNLAHRRLVGVPTPEDVLGKTVFDLFPRELAARYAADDEAILSSNQPLLNREEPAFDRAGSPKWLSTTKIPLRDGQRKIILCVSRDITERKRAEEAEKVLHAIQEEFRVARKIQQKLFPGAPPPLGHFDIGGASYPAEATGGDYFDYIPMLDGHVGIVIGDVSGHGFGPALLMASTRAYLRALAQTHTDVGLILTLANRVLAEDIEEDSFVTLLLARLDPRTRCLVYSSAGHPTGYVLDPRGALKTRLESTALPLGIGVDNSFEASAPVLLDAGDTVLMLTDGILEACSRDDEAFGTERALDIVRANRERPAQEIVAALERAVREFRGDRSQLDDITALVIKAVAGPPVAAGGASPAVERS